MNTLRNTEECRQNPSGIDLAASKSLCLADRFLLDLYLEVRIFFESYDLNAIKTLSALLRSYVESSVKNIPSNIEDAKYALEEIDLNVTYLSETVALISELHMRWEAVSSCQREASLDSSSIFFQPETAQIK